MSSPFHQPCLFRLFTLRPARDRGKRSQSWRPPSDPMYRKSSHGRIYPKRCTPSANRRAKKGEKHMKTERWMEFFWNETPRHLLVEENGATCCDGLVFKRSPWLLGHVMNFVDWLMDWLPGCATLDQIFQAFPTLKEASAHEISMMTTGTAGTSEQYQSRPGQRGRKRIQAS